MAAAAGPAGRHRPSEGPPPPKKPGRGRRGAAAGRDRKGRHQPAVPRTGRNQRRPAIRPAGGHWKTVARLARRRLRRLHARRRGGQRPGRHGEDQVVSTREAEGAAGRGVRGVARYLPGLAGSGRLRQRHRGEDLLPPQYGAAPSASHRGVDRTITRTAKGPRRVVPGVRGRAATALESRWWRPASPGYAALAIATRRRRQFSPGGEPGTR